MQSAHSGRPVAPGKQPSPRVPHVTFKPSSHKQWPSYGVGKHWLLGKMAMTMACCHRDKR